MKAKILYPVLIPIIIISGFVFTQKSTKPEAKDLSEKPQFSMLNFHQTLTDINGVVNSRISGETFEFFPKLKYALIKQPKFKQNSWLITANVAKRYSEVIVFEGNVIAGNGTRKLLTQEVTIVPKTEIVTSKYAVTLFDGKMQIKGIGLKLLGKTNTLNILKNAQTTYLQ